MKKVVKNVLVLAILITTNLCCKKDEPFVNLEANSQKSTSEDSGGFTSFVANNGKTYMVSKKDLSKIKEKLRSARGASTFTPKTTPGVLSKILNNQKILLIGVPNYLQANYFCDVYKSQAIISVPSGSFALFNTASGASVNGLVDWSNTTNLGSQAAQFGNTYTYKTHSIVPKFNLLGQALPFSVFPNDLTPNVFSYIEYTP